MKNSYCFVNALALLVTLMLCHNPLKSQSFIDGNRIWSVWDSYTAGGMGESGHRFKIVSVDVNGDTISGHLVAARNQDPNDWEADFGYLKEDLSHKVWYTGDLIYPYYLLYDFGLNEQDTFNYNIVDSVRYSIIGGINRKQFYFHNIGLPGVLSDYWVDGLGSMLTGLLFPFQTGTIGGFHNTVCIHENGNPVYENPAFTSCLPVSTIYRAEEWAPNLNCRWHYDYVTHGGAQWSHGYCEIAVLSNTIYLGQNCTMFNLKKVAVPGTESNIAFYTYQSGRKVYYSCGGPFAVLFDFGAHVGDSWIIRDPYNVYGLPPSPLGVSTITVDSTKLVMSNGTNILYREIYTHSSTDWQFHGPIQEKIGGMWFFFPVNWTTLPDPAPESLRCYDDGMLQPFHLIQGACNPIYTGMNDIMVNSAMLTVLNPVSDKFEIRINSEKELSCQVGIMNACGEKILNKAYEGIQLITIPAGKLASGLYFIKITMGDKQMIRKIIKL